MIFSVPVRGQKWVRLDCDSALFKHLSVRASGQTTTTSCMTCDLAA